jgi:hypothetical protein
MKGAGSSSLMFQSWPLQAVGAYLDSYPSSGAAERETTNAAVTEEVKQEICFGNELKDILQQQVDADLTFRVGSACIKAHRCLVMARCKGLARIIEGAQGETVHGFDVDDEVVINLPESRFGADPRLLETIIEQCYGFTTTHNNPHGQDAWKLGSDFVPDIRTYRADLLELQRFSSRHSERTLPGNIKIIGRNEMTKKEEWVLSAHSAILCAHSQYAKALLTHGWTIPTSPECGSKLLVLDASHFSRDVMEELLHACYTNSMPCLDYAKWFSHRRPPLEFFFRLYDGACFLGMEAISRLIARNIISRFGMEAPGEIIDFAERVESTHLVSQWKEFVCLEAGYMKSSKIASFRFHQFQAILMSDGLELPEEEILGMLLSWIKGNHVSVVETNGERAGQAKTLLKHIRLSLVPVGTSQMRDAVQQRLVDRQDVEDWHIYQTEGHERSLTRYELQSGLRKNEFNRSHLQHQKQSLLSHLDRALGD